MDYWYYVKDMRRKRKKERGMKRRYFLFCFAVSSKNNFNVNFSNFTSKICLPQFVFYFY